MQDNILNHRILKYQIIYPNSEILIYCEDGTIWLKNNYNYDLSLKIWPNTENNVLNNMLAKSPRYII